MAFFEDLARAVASAPKSVAVSFAGERNQTIASAQSEADRNPFFVTRRDLNTVQSILASGMTQLTRAGSVNARALHTALQDVGDMLVNVYRAHIHRRQSAGDPPVDVPASPHQTKALTEKYAKWKRKKFGTSVPELIASGEFIQSMRVTVK